MNDNSWKAVFDKYKIHEHNLEKELFLISAKQIKQATTHFKKKKEKLVLLCKQDSQRNRPKGFSLTTKYFASNQETYRMWIMQATPITLRLINRAKTDETIEKDKNNRPA